MVVEDEHMLQTIKQILVELANVNEGIQLSIDDISDNENISESEKLQLDSLKAIRMIVNIEEKFDIKVPDEELIIANFNSPILIRQYVIAKLKGLGE